MKEERKKINYYQISIITVILAICFLSVGFSSFTASNRIEGIMASVKPASSVRITNITLSNTSSGGLSNSEAYNVSNIYGNITLPNADSTVTYKVDVTVFLGAETKLNNITGLNSNLEYSISGYTLGEALCNNSGSCTYGATDDIYITIGYKSGGYNAGNTEFPFNLEFEFEQVEHTAKVGNTYFETLQDAIDAVPKNNVQTTIQLFKDVSEVLSVTSGQNILFNFNGHKVSNDGVNPVITNTGTIRIVDGIISSNTTQGAINNNSGGVIYMSGGTINATGSKQAIYNDGGTLEISGTAYLKNTSSNRPAVHNLNGGLLTILGGKIESTNYRGVENHSTMSIGVLDGNAANTPVITGKTNGIFSDVNFNYYDGIIKGNNNAFNDETYIANTDPQLVLNRTTENINNINYKVVQLVDPVTITFNCGGGTCSEASRVVNKGNPIGTLPDAVKTDYIFDGWFDASSGGNEVSASTIFTQDTEIFAHYHQTVIAKIGNTEYPSITAAINAVPNNTQTTILIMEDIQISSAITIATGKNIIFDLQNHTISNKNGAYIPLFENNGIAEIKNGTLVSNAAQGAVNNRNSATSNLTLSNLTVNAVGIRQALYIEKGTVNVKDNTVLSNTTDQRGAVQVKGGTLNILSATIRSTSNSGIVCEGGTINVGSKDGNISTTNPLIQGGVYGVNITGGSFKFYDGILKGLTDAYNGTIADSDGTIVTGVSGDYKTAYLE